MTTKNPQLDPIWDAIPYPDRYTLDGVRYVCIRRKERKPLVPLAELTQEEVSLILAQGVNLSQKQDLKPKI